MASEITVQAQLEFIKGLLGDDFVLPRTLLTMNGKNYIHRTQSILSTDTTLDLASLATPGLALFVNRGPSTVVTIKNAAAGTVIPKLKVGEPALFRFDTTVTAPVAISSTIVISAASNASPVEMTAAALHLLTTGDIITISGFTGAWVSCNGTFPVIVTSTTKFTIAIDSSGFGAIAGSPVFVCASLEYLILED